MKQTRLLMGMPITVEIVDERGASSSINEVYDYFKAIDERFSTYKSTSEISRINRGLPRAQWSSQMKHVLDLCEQTKRQTGGYFDIEHAGKLDPSGLVKGWAIHEAAKTLAKNGHHNFYIEAGGDVQAGGHSADHEPWRVGIQNPFGSSEIVKVFAITTEGVATSGDYVRGAHIYNPHGELKPEIASLSVIGPNIYEADRFATAAYAMGQKGINFIELMRGFEAYMIDKSKTATMTSGLERYIAS